MKWQYPNKLGIEKKIITKLYTNQTFGNTKVPRFAIFSTEDLQIASFFGGRSCTDMAVLILEEDENPKEFEVPLINFYFNVIKGKIEEITSERRFKEIFNKLPSPDEDDSGIEFVKKQFDAFLQMFSNFIETIDKRLTQIENLILKTSS